MMVCGNCGYWKFHLIESRFAIGICLKMKGPHYLDHTPYSLKESCWEPEGGRGNTANNKLPPTVMA